LFRAVGAEKAVKPARFDAQIELVDGPKRPEVPRQFVGFDGWMHGVSNAPQTTEHGQRGQSRNSQRFDWVCQDEQEATEEAEGGNRSLFSAASAIFCS